MAFYEETDEDSLGSRIASQNLFDSYTRWRFKDMPQFATFAGVHDYDDLLDDMSEEAYEARYTRVVDFLNKAKYLLPTLASENDIINTTALIEELTIYKDGHKYKGVYLPINFSDGLHLDFEKLLSWMPRNTETDFENMVSRIIAVDKQASQIIALMQRGTETGIVHSNYAMKGIVEALDTYIVEEPEDSPIYKRFFQTFPEDMTAEQTWKVQDKAKAAINNHMVPAFKRVRDFLSNSYKPRSIYSASAHPAGIAYYNQLIRVHTSTELHAEEIHQMGMKEVKRIQEEIQMIVSELGHDMTVKEFAKMIQSDLNNYFSSPEQFLEEFSKICNTVIPPHLPKLFSNIPKSPLSVQGCDNPALPFAFYNVGTSDGTRPGTVTINTALYNSRPKFSLMTLALHEAIPGHHLQRSYSIENPKLPLFRRVVDDRNNGHFPSKFPTYSSFVEGWALYAETLGTDLGLLDDPLERFGHYSSALFRACRLVVDTGIHALGWTREQAVEFMVNHSLNSKESIENEIDRYITRPGQALAYKMGEFRIRSLKQEAEKRLGTSFNVKDFHTVILESYGTMNLVESRVQKWIDRVVEKNNLEKI